MMSTYWLFSFTYYTYCQGTRDRNHGYKLIKFSLPCEEWEAKEYLIVWLNRTYKINFEEDSIQSETISITNS